MAEKVRIDKYLWSIRLFKTRSLASAACEAGKVKWKGDSVKPAKAVLLNEEYEVRNEAGRKIIKVVGIIDHRVAYSEAITYYVDLTPEEENLLDKPLASSFYTGKRLSKVGRPTKQQRRDRDKFFDE
jgi:ribosome-associated heat shock protein Hsp15